MKKIGLLLQSNQEVGGIYQYCLTIVNAINTLDKKKYEFHIYYSEKFWKEKLPKNIKKTFIKENFFFKLVRKILFYFIRNDESWRLFRNFIYEDVKTLNRSSCDYIIMPSQNRASYLVNKKTITSIHDLMHLYEKYSNDYDSETIEMRNKHYRMICKYSNYIFADSFLGKKHIIDSYKCSSKKIFSLPYTIPLYLEKKKSKKFNKKLPNKFLFYPAQFWEHKNHINLLRAFSKIEKNNIKDLHLVFTGIKKNFYHNIFSETKSLNLTSKVVFLGKAEDEYMRDIYKKSFATIFVSSLGPTNIPPLEAISVGSPLICSKVYAMKEQVRDAAIFINPKDPDSIYDGIIKMYKNKSLRNNLIKKGKELFKQKNQQAFNENFRNIIYKITK